MFDFDNKIVVGASVSIENGLEIAQVDYDTKTVIKYGRKPCEYNFNEHAISDLDLFKSNLQELLEELEIPKGSEISLVLPSDVFEISDYPAAMTSEHVESAINTEIADRKLFGEFEPNISAIALPASTMQFNKIAYIAASKSMLIELALRIEELGYVLNKIDLAVSTTLNALIYNERLQVENGASWILMLVDRTMVRILHMLGTSYAESYKSKINIGEVLGDAENYSIVTNEAEKFLKLVPSSCLYVISKTDLISAKILSDKISFGGTKIYQEANCFTKELFLNVTPDLADVSNISIDVIGAAISREYEKNTRQKFNLFNKGLGDVYTQTQPVSIMLGDKEFVFSVKNSIIVAIALVALIALIFAGVFLYYSSLKKICDEKTIQLDNDIAIAEKFLKENDKFSTNVFDEGDEVGNGIEQNKSIYTYYTVVGTEIPKKLWLSYLKLGGHKHTTIQGQADDIASIYSFFRNIKDYNPESGIKLQKLGLSTKSRLNVIDTEDFDTDSILTSMDADFYEFKISDEEEAKNVDVEANDESGSKRPKGTEKLELIPPKGQIE